jgi:hypothetical protein
MVDRSPKLILLEYEVGELLDRLEEDVPRLGGLGLENSGAVDPFRR